VKRFPLGLTAAVMFALAALIGLGLWQLQRLTWKQQLIARVEALRTAPARPAAEILALAAQGRDVAYRRVDADCQPNPASAHNAYRYALRDGQVGWRLMTMCHLRGQPYDGVLLDRGLVNAFMGAMAPEPATFAEPGDVIGVLRLPGGKPLLGPAETAPVAGLRVYRVVDQASLKELAAQNAVRHPAPYILAVESERPAPAGIIPAALPRDIPNNHFVYALTWFALAAVLLCIYGAMILRRWNGR
jgi:surfeit locus 1 family protein